MLFTALRKCAPLLLVGVLLLLLPLTARAAIYGPAFVPNDPYFNYNPNLPEFPGQWHLRNQAPEEIRFIYFGVQMNRLYNAGLDSNVWGAWEMGLTGQGVVIGIVDDGVQGNHPDLAPGYQPGLSRNFTTNPSINSQPQGPRASDDNHGTAVAGVAAARGGNGIGVTGAAPYAQIAAMRIRFGNNPDDRSNEQNLTDAYYWQSGVNAQTGAYLGEAAIPIKNHSYGFVFPYVINESIARSSEALERTAMNGVLHVFSAGNSRGEPRANSNTDIQNTLPGVIAVAALSSNGKYSKYSSYGANVFITAPSNDVFPDETIGGGDTPVTLKPNGFGITTTDRTGVNLGYNRWSENSNPDGEPRDFFPDDNYTSTFGGTSSAAPLVSGILALGKQANPNMDVRLAKHALARSAVMVDPTDNSSPIAAGWQTNAAGFHFNPNYGFGIIDATGFVTTLRDTAYLTTRSTFSLATVAVGAEIPKGAAGITRNFTIAPGMLDQPIESVVVSLDIESFWYQNLNAVIISPSGMQSHLIYPVYRRTERIDIDWDFLSNAFWGEDGIGEWTINIKDIDYYKDPNETSTWNSFAIAMILGDVVFEKPGVNLIDYDVQASSLSIDHATTEFVIAAGRSFSVSQGSQLSDGVLVVNGHLTEAAEDGFFKGNQLTIRGGLLEGSGQITARRGVVNQGGIINPGNSIGTLTINGDFTQTQGGNLVIEFDGTNSDLLVVNGTATLGGLLTIDFLGGYVPQLGDSFTFLDAYVIQGWFNQVNAPIATPIRMFLPEITATDITMVFTVDYANPVLAAFLTPNQLAVGQSLNSITPGGPLDAILNEVDTLTTFGEVAAAYQAIIPGNTAVPSSLTFDQTARFTRNLDSRTRSLRPGFIEGGSIWTNLLSESYAFNYKQEVVLLASIGRDFLPYVGSPPGKNWTIWANGGGSLGYDQSSITDLRYDTTTANAMIGLDYQFAENSVIGLLVGYGYNDAKFTGGQGSVTANTGMAGIYAATQQDGFFITGLAGYGIGSYDLSRQVNFPGPVGTASASTDGRYYLGYIGGGFEWDTWPDFNGNRFSFGPTFGLQYVNFTLDSYTETGAGPFNMTISQQTAQSLRATAGARMAYVWNIQPMTIMPEIRVNYVHEFLDNSRGITNQFATGGAAPFTIFTGEPDRNYVIAGAGLSMLISQDLSISIDYDATLFRANSMDHNLNAQFRYGF